MQDAFKPRHTPKPTKTGPQTLLSLTLANQSLSEDVKFRLLGPIKSSDDDWDVGTIDALSPAEAYAFHVSLPGFTTSYYQLLVCNYEDRILDHTSLRVEK